MTHVFTVSAIGRKAAKTAGPARTKNERLEATDFGIGGVHEADNRTIEDARTIRLDAKESRTFAKALLNPREPTDRLRKAARRYLDTIER